MTKFARIALIVGLGAMIAACGNGGLLNRDRPDEFAVQRAAPLVVPPDFNLTPPQPRARRRFLRTSGHQLPTSPRGLRTPASV